MIKSAIKWIDLVLQIKAPDDLFELFPGIGFPYEIAVGNLSVFQDKKVTREYDPQF